MITDVAGVRVGHWTDPVARTGCTVVLFPEGTIASGEIRGGSPATREWALLDPIRTVQRIDALVLSGGSAFGLAAGDGVMGYLAEQGVGFPTVGGVVPIVVGVSLYDLAVGDGSVRPDADAGRAAAVAASDGPIEVGLVGAGTGATIDKWRGLENRRPGGLVTATRRGPDGVVVAALIAVNAFGEPGASAQDVAGGPSVAAGEAWQNTTIGVVVTNASLDKLGCRRVAEGAHDGLARSIAPTHTAVDGDAFVVAATGTVTTDPGTVRNLAVAVVESAIGELSTSPRSTDGS